MPNAKNIIQHFFAPLLTDEYDMLEQIRSNTILAPKQRYFDFTASGLGFKSIQKRMATILPYYANTHSYFAPHSALMSELYEESKRKIAHFLNLQDDFVLIAGGSGASFGIKKIQEILGIYVPPRTIAHIRINKSKLKNLPHVIISGYEHHSNEISFREGLCHLHKIAFDTQGLPDVQSLKSILKNIAKHTKKAQILASISAASNVTGLLTPIKSFVSLLRAHNSIIALDLASLSAYNNIDSMLFDVAFLAPHKLLGGVGSCGLLALRKNLLDSTMPPSFSGGGVIEYANESTHQYITHLTQREEAGTPPILGLLCAALAYQLRDEIGCAWIKRREHILTQAFLYELAKIPAVSIYGDLNASRLGIVSFNIGSISPLELCALLGKKFGVHTRAGCSCAGPYGHYLINDGNSEKKPAWLRVSIHYSHSISDIEYLIDSIKSCVKILRGA